MKRKQFVKGITQIAQEGAIQIFQEFNTGMEEIIVGVVGVLQFDVLKYRLENEYNVEIRLENLPYEHIRWIENKDIDLDKLTVVSARTDTHKGNAVSVRLIHIRLNLEYKSGKIVLHRIDQPDVRLSRQRRRRHEL